MKFHFAARRNASLLIAMLVAGGIVSACSDASTPSAAASNDARGNGPTANEDPSGPSNGQAVPLGPDPSGSAARYPIILVHGFTGSRKVWNFVDVSAALIKDGHYVYEAELPPVGTPDDNGKALAMQVDEVLRITGAEKANLVAHSKGGVDSRAYISNFHAGDKIASLTTIASPHRGSYVVDVALKLIPDNSMADRAYAALASIWTGFVSNRELDEGNNLRPSLESMSEKSMARFNETHPDDSRVFYQSWGGVSNVLGIANPRDEEGCEGKGYLGGAPRDVMDPLFLAAAPFVAHGTEFRPNDGVATVESAKWGEFCGCIPADHKDDVGRNGHRGVDSRSGFDHIRFYRQVAFDLSRRGF